MAPRMRKCLVIDASVARAAGAESATFPVSKHCRDLLKAVRTICHRILLEDPTTNKERTVRREWNENASRFSRTWLNSMFGRKKLDLRTVPENEPLRRALSAWAPDEGIRKAVDEDAHLIEAALAADRIVISCDDTARGYFMAAAGQFPRFLGIAWVNPTQEAPNVLQWLERNPPLEPVLLLTAPSG